MELEPGGSPAQTPGVRSSAERILGIQRRIHDLVKWLDLGIFLCAGVLLAFLVAALFLQVLFRYVILQPLAWTEETARFALIWYAMLAAGMAVRKGQQFVFRWFAASLPAALGGWLRQLISVVTLTFLCVLLAQSVDYLSIVNGQRSAATQIDMRIPYAGITAGVGYLIVVYLSELADAAMGVVTRRRFSLQEEHELRMQALLKGDLPADEVLP